MAQFSPSILHTRSALWSYPVLPLRLPPQTEWLLSTWMTRINWEGCGTKAQRSYSHREILGREHPLKALKALKACLELSAPAGIEPLTVCYFVAKLLGWTHFNRALGSWAIEKAERVCSNFLSACFFKLSRLQSPSLGVFTPVIPALGRWGWSRETAISLMPAWSMKWVAGQG